MDVDVHAFAGLGHGLRHADQRGQVEDVIDTLHGLADQRAVGDGAFDECAFQAVEIFPVAGAQVVEHADFLRHVLIVFDDVGADEAGAAGDEDFHWKGLEVCGFYQWDP